MTTTRAFITMTIFALGCTAEDDRGMPFSPSTGSATGSATGSGGSDDHGDHGEHGSDGVDTGAPTPPGTTGSADDGPDDDSTGAAAESTGVAAIDTWESWASPQFFAVYCEACHPGQSTIDFTLYDSVVANEEHIRCGVAPEAIPSCDPGHIEPGHLPIGSGPFPSDEERWRLVDWMLAGMPRD